MEPPGCICYWRGMSENGGYPRNNHFNETWWWTSGFGDTMWSSVFCQIQMLIVSANASSNDCRIDIKSETTCKHPPKKAQIRISHCRTWQNPGHISHEIKTLDGALDILFSSKPVGALDILFWSRLVGEVGAFDIRFPSKPGFNVEFQWVYMFTQGTSFTSF